jgi:hypothetical protein
MYTHKIWFNVYYILVTFATIISVLYKNNSILYDITGFKKHQIFVDDEQKIKYEIWGSHGGEY